MNRTLVALLCSAALVGPALAQVKPIDPQPPRPASKPSAAERATTVQPGTAVGTRPMPAAAPPPAAPSPCTPKDLLPKPPQKPRYPPCP